MQKYSTVQTIQVNIHFDNYNIEHLLEENTVCPRRPSLLIGELHLLAWTEQESHACNVNQADRTQHLEVIFQLYVFLYIFIIQIFSSPSISRSIFFQMSSVYDSNYSIYFFIFCVFHSTIHSRKNVVLTLILLGKKKRRRFMCEALSKDLRRIIQETVLSYFLKIYERSYKRKMSLHPDIYSCWVCIYSKMHFLNI